MQQGVEGALQDAARGGGSAARCSKGWKDDKMCVLYPVSISLSVLTIFLFIYFTAVLVLFQLGEKHNK